MTYLVETPEKSGILAPELSPAGEKIKSPKTQFKITVPLAKAAAAGDKIDLRLSLLTFICSETSSLCRIRSLIWNVPITFSETGSTEPIVLTEESKVISLQVLEDLGPGLVAVAMAAELVAVEDAIDVDSRP